MNLVNSYKYLTIILLPGNYLLLLCTGVGLFVTHFIYTMYVCNTVYVKKKL